MDPVEDRAWTCSENIEMQRVVRSALHMIVDQSSESLGPKSSVDKPLLIPNALQGARRDLGYEAENVRAAKSGEILLFFRIRIRVTGVERGVR
jgi:hypothetical protein